MYSHSLPWRCLGTALALTCGLSSAAQPGSPAWHAAPMSATAPAETKVFPLAEVHRGLHGVAYTVFQGVNPEPMEVEILGILKDAIGPGQDMILARLHGEKAEYTGVVAGMSGSPVYIDGRLAGALSYRIGQFSKEPIAGITPIEQMFEVRDGGGTTGMRTASAPIRPTATATSASGEIEPIATPLIFGGFSQETIDRFGDRFRALGLSPVAGLGGASAPGTRQPEPIVPGSAVSAILVQGDLSMAGTCTVTYVDPKQLLACGHPITQYGSLSIPMTKAEVVATLASPLNAFKIINTTETVGSFTEDRSSAILGQFNVPARMIPVAVEIVADGPRYAGARAAGKVTLKPVGGSVSVPAKPTRTMHFEVLDNRALTPSAMLSSVYQSLSGTNSAASELSYRMSGDLTVAGQPPVHLSGVMTPTDSGPAAVTAALYVNDRFSKLYGDSIEQPVMTGLRLQMEELPERRSAVLDSARLSRTDLHAGDTLEIEATIHPYQADARIVRIPVTLPPTLTPGALRLIVSDGATVDRLAAPSGPAAAQHPLALADTVAQLNRLHPNDRLYVTLLDHTTQAVLDSGALTSLPISMANVLEPLKASQKLQLTGESITELGSADAGYALTGSQILTLTVR